MSAEAETSFDEEETASPSSNQLESTSSTGEELADRVRRRAAERRRYVFDVVPLIDQSWTQKDTGLWLRRIGGPLEQGQTHKKNRSSTRACRCLSFLSLALSTRPLTPFFFQKSTSFDSLREQLVYKFSAIAATVGIVALAAFAVHARFSWMREEGDVPATEAAATMLLALGGMVRFFLLSSLCS